ncbi:Uncharacterised protein [uncultured archaeon]|nr:Uncharacterised protein [uncultured archaeon]
MKPAVVLIALVMIAAQFALAGAEQAIDTNDTSGVNAINTGAPSIAPDSVFWGLKNAFDRLSLALTFNPQSRAEKGLQIAEERLREFRKMAEKGDVAAAEKAKASYDDYVQKAKTAAGGISENNKTVEMEKQIEIQNKVEEFESHVENESAALKVKIEVHGNLTPEQKAFIDSLVQGMQNQTGSLKVEIEQNKERIKVEIKQRTGKSDDEIENEIEGIENRTHLSTIRSEKALEEIAGAQKELAKLEADISANNVTDQAVLVLLNNSRQKLSEAQNALNASKSGEAYGLANAAQHLAENAREKIGRLLENTGEHQEGEKELNETGKLEHGDSNQSGERGHDRFCIQVITPAKNEKTGECKEFPTPCSVPDGWEKVDSCQESSAHNETKPV